MQIGVEKGAISIDGQAWRLQSFQVRQLIAAGANGCVFKVYNELLARDEALKVWLKLRDKDDRDKLTQGLFEARKSVAFGGHYIVTIYSAGILEGGLFYTTMEYIDGPSAKEALKTLSVEERLRLAIAYVNAIYRTSDDGSVHGDPHLGNVLLDPAQVELPTGVQKYRKFEPFPSHVKLCDFGSSYHMKRGDPNARHWRIVKESLDKILLNTPHYSALRAMWSQYYPLQQAAGNEGKAVWFMDLVSGMVDMHIASASKAPTSPTRDGQKRL